MPTARTYRVYVIGLDPAVAELPRFLKRNPGYVKGRPCVYVGSSFRSPEERFRQHKNGYKCNVFAKKYGRYLKRRLTARVPEFATREEAEAAEVAVAERLRKRGYAVWQG